MYHRQCTAQTNARLHQDLSAAGVSYGKQSHLCFSSLQNDTGNGALPFAEAHTRDTI